jgi:hypothetical protein
MIKGNPIPQVYTPQEGGSVGVSLRNANNGSVRFSINNSGDIGRAVAAHLDPAYPGFQFWASGGMGLYDINGNVIGSLPNNGNNSSPGNNLSINFLIWWSGALSRETLDGDKIARWDIRTNTGSRLLTAAGTSSNNGSKSTPVLTADIFGDWREEVIWAAGNNAIRIYTSTMPTTHRLVTMMHDPVYRVAVAWQNSSYNQPPHPGYYIASDMDFPPPPLNVAVVGGGPVDPPNQPTVTLTAPTGGERYWPGETINFAATASAPGGIAQVEFYANIGNGGMVKIGERTTSPYTFAWTNPPAGRHGFGVNATAVCPAPQCLYLMLVSLETVTVGALVGSGEFIDSLGLMDPSNAANWSIRNNFGVSSKAYGDRDFQTVAVSSDLQGAEWISASAETRTLTSPDTIIRFRMKKAGVVYVAHEDRVSPRPAWIAARGFTATSHTVSVADAQADRPFTVYSRLFQQGETVVMGRNSNDGTTTSLMYIVAIKEPSPTSVVNKPAPANNSLNIVRMNGGSFAVNYSVKEQGAVRVDLFDVKGSRVKTLVNSSRNPGSYREHFSADGLAAGVYLVRMNVGKQVLREKVLIAR